MKSYILTPGLLRTMRDIEHCSRTSSKPLMICGPTGAGKSLFLRAAGKLRKERHGENFEVLSVNCAIFGGDHNIVRAELFGNIRGVVPGLEARDGWFRKADRGLLVLDEIGELSESIQSMLLTFTETGRFQKLGSSKTETADVRIVAATNNRRRLREDFRFRFSRAEVPPVCERRPDILFYAAAKYPDLIPSLSSRDILGMLEYDWPGNVREIEDVCESPGRIADLCSGRNFSPDRVAAARGLRQVFSDRDLFETDERFDLLRCREDILQEVADALRVVFRSPDISGGERPGRGVSENEQDIFSETYEELTKIYFRELLIRYKLNRKKAAEHAGLIYTTFLSKIGRLGLNEWLDSMQSEMHA